VQSDLVWTDPFEGCSNPASLLLSESRQRPAVPFSQVPDRRLLPTVFVGVVFSFALSLSLSFSLTISFFDFCG